MPCIYQNIKRANVRRISCFGYLYYANLNTSSTIIYIIVGNNLKGTLPNELNYFSEMVVLNMFYNKLTGSIPDLSYLVNLEQLDLDGNELSGSTPASLFNLPSLSK